MKLCINKADIMGLKQLVKERNYPVRVKRGKIQQDGKVLYCDEINEITILEHSITVKTLFGDIIRIDNNGLVIFEYKYLFKFSLELTQRMKETGLMDQYLKACQEQGREAVLQYIVTAINRYHAGLALGEAAATKI